MRCVALISASLAMLIGSIIPVLAQSRVALVIANSAYEDAPALKTTIADATLVGTTLAAAGYDVSSGVDLGGQDMSRLIGQFRDKLAAAGPNAVAFLYFAGYGAQGNGDDYLVPVDAQIGSPGALSSQALSLSDVISTLAQVPAAARIIVLDAARDHGFGKKNGRPVALGLALIQVPPGFLVAYSAAPNHFAPDGDGPNSPFASALATLMRQPGLDIEQILNGVRLQVNQASKGTQLPWMTSSLNVEVKLFDAPPTPVAGNSAPTPAASDNSSPVSAQGAAPTPPQTLAPALGVSNLPVPPKTRRHLTKRMMQDMSPDDAYQAAIEDDSLPDYQSFVEAYPDYSMAGQVWDIIHNIRDGVLWNRARAVDSTAAYWDYLARYPDGPHAWEAREWLDDHGEPPPPSDYVAQPLDLPPDYSDEAMGLPDIVQEGADALADVFGDGAPIDLPDAPPWNPQQVVVIPVQPVPQIPNTPPSQTPATPLPSTPGNPGPSPLNQNGTAISGQAQTGTAASSAPAVQPVPGNPGGGPVNQNGAAQGQPPAAPGAAAPTDVTHQQLLDQVSAALAKSGGVPQNLKNMTHQQLKAKLASTVADYQAQQEKKDEDFAKKHHLPPPLPLQEKIIANIIDQLLK